MNPVSTLIALAFLSGSALAASPNDAQIAQIVVSADRSEISASKLAEEKSKNPEIRDFAKMMIDAHGAVTKKTKDLADRIDLHPKSSDTSRSLAKETKKNAKKLKSLDGESFDKEYIDQMVAGHEKVLETIDRDLIPNAKNPELKSLVEEIRPDVAHHLERAKTIQAKLENPPNSG